MKKIIFVLVLLFSVVSFTTDAFSHCQIPCGIYDDQARFDMIAEHITTIEKSITKIQELSVQENKNFNQIVRWVNNKETHADYIIEIATQYFLAQRMKPVAEDDSKAYNAYVKKVTLLHEIVINAMKAKQNADLEYVSKLRSLLKDFQAAYFGQAEKKEGVVKQRQ
ncbi:superoxide dismutase [Ni] [Candidatus Omnitrophota bacterium]